MLAPLVPFASLPERGNPFNLLAARPDAFSSKTGLTGPHGFAENIQRSNSFELFNSILQKAYGQIGFKPGHGFSNPNQPESNIGLADYALSDFQSVEKISPNQAARTILDFVTQRIHADAANGASQQELLERLDQGLQGFIKGFNEAKDIIEGLGLLTPALAEEINDTYARVTGGIEALRDNILGKADDSSEIGEANHTTQLSRVLVAAQTNQSSSFSLSLTTQDGDRVTIEIARSSQSSFSAAFDHNANGSSLSINQQRSTSSSFSLNVIGELDEGELGAINQLLQDVDTIANDFFGGRLDQAFEQALQLEINREELSSLNLQLKKTTTVQALAAYQSTAQNSLATESESKSVLESPFAELTHLIDILQDISDKAGKFADPTRLIEDLAAGVSRIGHQQQEQENSSELGEKLKELISQFGL